MYRNSRIYKTVASLLVAGVSLLGACTSDNVITEPSGESLDLVASVDTRALTLSLSDFSDVKLFYPIPNGNGYDSLDITSSMTLSGTSGISFRGAMNDFFWTDVNDSPTSQFYIVAKYQGDQVWGNAIAGNTYLSSNIARHRTLDFNNLQYRFSKLNVVIKTKDVTLPLNGDMLRVSLNTYRPLPTNSFLKRQVACSDMSTIKKTFDFSGEAVSFVCVFTDIPEQDLTEATRYLNIRYAGIDYFVDLYSLPVNRGDGSSDKMFRYIAGENITLTLTVQPSVVVRPEVSVNTSSWNDETSLGALVGSLVE